MDRSDVSSLDAAGLYSRKSYWLTRNGVRNICICAGLLFVQAMSVACAGENPPVSRFQDEISGRTIVKIELSGFRHAYAKNQPWNSDESLLLLGFSYPAALLDGKTYRMLKLVRPPSQAVWSNTDPDALIGVAWKRAQIVRYRPNSDSGSVVADFPHLREIDFGGGEGNLSRDDTRIAFFGKGEGGWDVFLYDFSLKRVLGRYRLGASAVGGTALVDNVTVSTSGRFVVVGFREAGSAGGAGVLLLDENLRYVRRLSARGGSHFDICVHDRQEYWVGTDDNTSALVAIDLANGASRVIVPAADISYNIHLSCRSEKDDGYVYVTEYFNPEDRKVASQRRIGVARVNTEGVTWLTSTRSSPTVEYSRASMAVPSRRSGRILWSSDWGDASGTIHTYVLEGRQDRSSGRPQ